MILDEYVNVRWNNFTKGYYIEKGYEFTHIHDNFLVKVQDLKPNSEVLVHIKCDFCDQEKYMPYKDYNRHIIKNGNYMCLSCLNKKKHDDFIKYKAPFYYQKIVDVCNNNGYTIVSQLEDYKNARSKIKYICPIHGEKISTYVDLVLNGCRCNDCRIEESSIKNRKDISEVVKIIESKNNNKLLNPYDYVNINKKNLIVLCGSCNTERMVSLSSIINSNGMCVECARKYQTRTSNSIEDVKQRIESVNNNILLNPQDYINDKTLNLSIKCSCGNVFVTSLVNYEYSKVNRCGICSQRISKGELQIINILNKYNISYIPEYRFSDCRDKKPLPFDFYLDDYNCIIEFDGRHHFEPIYGKDRFEITKLHDEIKNKYCDDHGIRLIRIPYYYGGNIEDIIIKEFNLSEIKYISYPVNK